jgi:sulfur-carrier protein
VNLEVVLFGQLLPGKQRRQTLEIEKPITVSEVANMLGLNPEEVGLITINGVQSEMEDGINSDSRLCFFPHMSGG